MFISRDINAQISFSEELAEWATRNNMVVFCVIIRETNAPDSPGVKFMTAANRVPNVGEIIQAENDNRAVVIGVHWDTVNLGKAIALEATVIASQESLEKLS